MRFLLRTSVIIAFTTVGAWSLAQPENTGWNDRLQFQHVTAADGLSDNSITCIFEDRSGFIWIGTERGLNRYDGQRVQQFTKQGFAPCGSRITSIAQDSSGVIWVSTSDAGLARYNTVNGTFTCYLNGSDGKKALPTNYLNHITALNDSMLVISSQDGGLIWFNSANGTTVVHKYARRGFKGNVLGNWYHSTTLINADQLWCGLIPGGNSYVLDPINGNIVTEVVSDHADSIYSLTNATRWKDKVLAGGWGPGLSILSVDRWNEQAHIPLDDEITAIVPWHDGSLFLGTKINGIIRLNSKFEITGRYNHKRRVNHSLINDRVRCMTKDRRGNLWVGTSGGVSVHAPSVWQMNVTELFATDAAEQPDLTFHALQQDPDGSIRISTSHGFFVLPTPNAIAHRIPLFHQGKPLEITGLYSPLKGVHILGTETGYYKYDLVNERIIPGPSHSVSSNIMYQVRSMHADTFPDGPCLIAGALGWAHSKLDPTSLVVDPIWYAIPEKGLGIGLINCTEKDSKGRYWSGASNGVLSWSVHKNSATDSSVAFTSNAPVGRKISGNEVSDIMIIRDTVWIAMRNAGLASIANGKVHTYPIPTFLSNDLLGLAVDDQGRIWCATGNGLLRFDPVMNRWTHIPINDGGTFKQLTKCIMKLQDGTMALCADNSLITFNPDAFNSFPELPLPYLTSVNNTWGSVLPNSEGIVEIPYRASSFDATVSALWPTGPAPLELVYRLDNVEEEPRVGDARTPLRYAGVPIGKHALLVRVRDAYGRIGPEVSLFTVNVPAPIWQRWWFYAALITLGAITMWLIGRFRQQQTMRLQSMRDHIARDLHDDVGSTLGSISFYSEALKRKLEEIDDPMAKDVASRIGNSSRDMIDRMADIVWSVDPKNDDAGSLIERMKGYAGDLVATRGIEMKWNMTGSIEHIKLGTEHRRNLFMIFKEAIYNSVKYAACTQIHVSLNITNGNIELTVSDNGKGFDPDNVDSYNGNGLPGMQTRAKAMGGQVFVESSPGNGTTVIAVAPINASLPRSGD